MGRSRVAAELYGEVPLGSPGGGALGALDEDLGCFADELLSEPVL